MKTGKFLTNLILLGFIGLSCISVIYIFIKTQTPIGGMDFHQYWYAGLFIRNGSNPFQAFLADDKPTMPLFFIDRKGVVTQDPAQPGLAQVPANTALIVLLLSPLSFFSWSVAKNIWMIFNYLFMLAIPPLVIRIFSRTQDFSSKEKIFLTLVFISLFGTRNAATNGQTSLFVFLCMLAAVWLSQRNSWILSGLLLGFALSKYSLALPVFLFMIYKKNFRVIVLSISVQLLGVLIVAMLTHSHPIAILFESYQIMKIHLLQSGIHIADFFPDKTFLSMAAPAILTVLVFSIVYYNLSGKSKMSSQASYRNFNDQLMLVILTLWTLLVAYHRAYDSLVVILFLEFGFYLFINRKNLQLSKYHAYFLLGILSISIFIFSLPASGINLLQGTMSSAMISGWIQFHNHLISLTLFFLLGYSLWLFVNLEKFTQKLPLQENSKKL